MIKVFNNIIPFEGYIAITVMPFIFVRKDLAHKYDTATDRHEHIHGRQQLEFLVVALALMAGIILISGISWWWLCASPVLYFIWYGIEYLIRDLAYGNDEEAYRNVSFEQEAFLNEGNSTYLSHRKPFAWVRYIPFKTYRHRTPSVFDSDNF